MHFMFPGFLNVSINVKLSYSSNYLLFYVNGLEFRRTNYFILKHLIIFLGSVLINIFTKVTANYIRYRYHFTKINRENVHNLIADIFNYKKKTKNKIINAILVYEIKSAPI